MGKNGSIFKAMIKRLKTISFVYWLLLFLIFLATIFFIQYKRASKSIEIRPDPAIVSIAAAKTKNVPVYITALGSVIPPASVVIKTQVNGQLLKLHFKEGQWVKAGDLLAEIDSKPYEAQLLQAEGQLAKDTALLADARLDLKRYETLWKQNSISKQTLDTQTWLVKQYEGAVKSDQGLLESARVNLAYCRIQSPLDGRTGLRFVDPGNVVQTTDTNGLVVVNAINPIEVEFSIPEDNIPQVLKHIRSGGALVVKAYDRGQEKLLKIGKLFTIDNQIDPTTGTVKLKAVFLNEDEVLFPQQFVNIKLMVDTIKNATTIPTMAIQHGVQGAYVYILKNDKTVSVASVKTGVTDGEDTMVLSGVSPGQFVIIEGTDKLTDGASVKVVQKRPKIAQQYGVQ